MTSFCAKGESLVQCIALKRGRVFTHLKKRHPEIAFLQETHLRNQDHFLL